MCVRGHDNEHDACRVAKRLGADTVIDYKKDDFAEILHNYDLVLVTLGGETLGLFG